MMKFNNRKFELIRYRSANNDIQDFTSYITNTGHVISEKKHVKDLGVIMSDDCCFKSHVAKVTGTLRGIAAWILRTFKSRERTVLMTTWKSLAIPRHDYCSVLWSPHLAGQINELECIQWSFLRKCSNVHAEDYWDALKKHKLFSLQRRRERFLIIYTFKVLEGLTPPTGIVELPPGRRGRLLKVTTSGSTSTARYHSFNMSAPRIWNSLPASIRNIRNVSVDCFKQRLDKVLEQIPDQPQIPQLKHKCRANSNSIPQMISLNPTRLI